MLQSLGTIVVFAVLLAIGGGYFFWRAITSPYKGFAEPAKLIQIRKGLRTSTILRHLQAEGIIRDEYVPLIYIKVARYRESIKAGIYEFSRPESAAEVIDKLIRGDVVLKSVTIREGLDRFAIAHLFIAERLGSRQEWDAVTSNADLIRDIAPEATTLEGYLFPDTYKFSPGTTARAIAQTMVSNFRRHFAGEMAYISTGLNTHQTVTLASIVETEAKLPQERPLVASVYLNRLRDHMQLAADPTVIYALKLAGRWSGNIHKADLQIDSPYNTYRAHGLPPGPIANPGMASLRAAAEPARTNLLYFVARHDGSHAFSTNLADHNHNVEIYQKQWYRDARAASKDVQPQTPIRR